MLGNFDATDILWHGESIGMFLKEEPDEDYSALAMCFRIMTSPHGDGNGAIVLGEPNIPMGWPKKPNFVITDNFPLMRWLVDGWISRLQCFKGRPGFENMTWKNLRLHSKRPLNVYKPYVQTYWGNGITAVLTWEEVTDRLAVTVPAESNYNGVHDLMAFYMEMKHASLVVNGKKMLGKPVSSEDMIGEPMRTAFLGYTETWLDNGLDDNDDDF